MQIVVFDRAFDLLSNWNSVCSIQMLKKKLQWIELSAMLMHLYLGADRQNMYWHVSKMNLATLLSSKHNGYLLPNVMFM